MALKKRTRIIAWIYMVISVYSFLCILQMICRMHSSAFPWYATAQAFLWGNQWPFWIGLLKRQSWAWSALVSGYFLISLSWAYSIGDSLIHGGPKMGPHISAVTSGLGWACVLAVVVLPIWALATDRPSGWHGGSDNRQPDAEE